MTNISSLSGVMLTEASKNAAMNLIITLVVCCIIMIAYIIIDRLIK